MVLEDEAFAGDVMIAAGDDVVEEDGIWAEGVRAFEPAIIVHEVIDGGAIVFLAVVCRESIFAADDRLADVGIGGTGLAQDLEHPVIVQGAGADPGGRDRDEGGGRKVDQRWKRRGEFGGELLDGPFLVGPFPFVLPVRLFFQVCDKGVVRALLYAAMGCVFEQEVAVVALGKRAMLPQQGLVNFCEGGHRMKVRKGAIRPREKGGLLRRGFGSQGGAG